MTTDERIAQSKEMNKDSIQRTLEYCHKHGTDLVEVSGVSCPCEECAKYQKRIYSLSGNDKRFPKYPDWIRYDLCEHNCGLMTYPFFENFSVPTYFEGDIFEVSNRPFVDDRTPEEKAAFEERRDKIFKERKYRAEYTQLLELIPDLAPKSLAAYTRMKNSNSKGYLLLKEKAKSVGIEI